MQTGFGFTFKLVPFVGSTEAAKSRARCFGVVGRERANWRSATGSPKEAELNEDQPVQTPGTATFRNRWGEATALSGYFVSASWNSGCAKAARKAAADSQRA